MGSRAGLAFICCILSSLSACHRANEIRPDHPRLVAGVDLRDVTFYSAALNRQMSYRVFLPANLLAGQKLSVVYLLHGAGDDYRSWSNRSGVAAYARHGLILVMPDGGFSYYTNAVEEPKDKYDDYITKDLIADVESRFPAKHDRQSRAVIGISMGGFAAFNLALAHPGLYAFAGALSPSVDMPRRRFSIKRFGQWWRMRMILGPYGSKERAAHDPFELVKIVDPKTASYIYMTVGEQEPLLEPNRRFEARLQQYGFAHEFYTKPGFHDWEQWDAQIPGCFDSLRAHLAIQ